MLRVAGGGWGWGTVSLTVGITDCLLLDDKATSKLRRPVVTLIGLVCVEVCWPSRGRGKGMSVRGRVYSGRWIEG